jgi:hypothetical protein
VWLSFGVTIECRPTSRWYALFWGLIAMVMIAAGIAFADPSGGLGILIAVLLTGLGLGIIVVFLRASLTPVRLAATPDGVTVNAPAFFREAITLPKDRIYGVFFGARPLSGPASARHNALVISMPRTNLGIRFVEDLYLPEARPFWSTLVNNAFLQPRGNTTPVPAPTKASRGLLIHVDRPETVAQELAQLLDVDTGPIS